MDWIAESEHFTEYTHCEECADHDETLRGATIESIGMEELGNIGWDPMCFSSVEGKKYYMPALVRLSLETIDTDEAYFEQLLFHLEGNGEQNQLILGCTDIQREFIVAFVKYLIDEHDEEIEFNVCTDNVLRVHEIWLKS